MSPRLRSFLIYVGFLVVGCALLMHLAYAAANDSVMTERAMAFLEAHASQLVDDADSLAGLLGDGTAVTVPIPSDEIVLPPGIVVEPGSGIDITRRQPTGFSARLHAQITTASTQASVDRTFMSQPGAPPGGSASGGMSTVHQGVLALQPLNIGAFLMFMIGLLGIIGHAWKQIRIWTTRPEPAVFAAPIDAGND